MNLPDVSKNLSPSPESFPLLALTGALYVMMVYNIYSSNPLFQILRFMFIESESGHCLEHITSVPW